MKINYFFLFFSQIRVIINNQHCFHTISSGMAGDSLFRFLPVGDVVTGKQPTREEIQQHLYEIDGYVVKPITIRELTDIVKRFFQRRQRIDQGVQTFREAGADETLVAEYWQLCRIIAAGSSLLRIMPELEPDIHQILKRAPNRFDTIRYDYKILK